MRNLIAILLLISIPLSAAAQKERADIRQGNRLYQDGKYTEAEVGYKRAIEKNVNSYEANFNLSGSLYKQQRYEDAAVGYSKLSEDASDPVKQAGTLYNLGNSLLKQRKLDEAIEAYKSSLRIRPEDQQTKFNLAYAQKLKQEDDKKDDQDKDNKDNKNNQNQDQNKDQNQDNKDNKDDKDQNKDSKDDKDKKDQEQPQSPPPSSKDTERMLNAVQANEDNTKKKLEERKAEAMGRKQGKQW